MTSYIEEVPVKPTLAPGFTVVGQPSQAPVVSAAPCPCYHSQLQANRYYILKGSIAATTVHGRVELLRSSLQHKGRACAPEEGWCKAHCGITTCYAQNSRGTEMDMDMVLGKHHKFMEFATNSSPVQNAVASTSQLLTAPVEPLLLERLPIPTFKSMKEYDDSQKKHHTRSRKAKKAKNDSVHLPLAQLPHGRMLGNIQVFHEVSSSPIREIEELLFLEENLKVFPNSPLIINPKDPRARYFKALIESLNLDDNESYPNDSSLDMNHHTDHMSQVNYGDEPLDWGTPSAQDYELSSDNSIDDELAATAGISHLSLTSAPLNRPYA